MAQHLRVGSVVDIYTLASTQTVVHNDAVVTNVTDAYLEFEVSTPSPVNMVRPWSYIVRVDVVAD